MSMAGTEHRMAGSVNVNACPECGAPVATQNLRAHRTRVHPNAWDKVSAFTATHWKKAIFLATLVVGIAVVAYLASQPESSETSKLADDWVGKEAPDFTLGDIQGGTFTLSEERGGWVLVLFNEGLMCAPCMRQMADMDKDDARFAALGVMQVGMTVDRAENLAQWADANNVETLTVLSDPDLRVEREYDTIGRDTSMMAGTRAGHTYILVDPEGIIRWRADYGPGVMYVPQDDIYAEVKARVEG